jgi:dipeptidyl aminopeptidase/acylaminoacyl peptidase
MIRKSRAGEWSNTQLMRVENPFTHKLAVDLTLPGHLSLSPDSRRLLLTFVSDSVPESWKTDPLVQAYALKTILVLYDIKTHTSRLALNSISPSSTPLWSPDSQRFFVNAGSPVGSSWQKSDVLRHRLSPADANLFSVDVHSGAVREVVEDVPDHHEGPLRIANNGDLIVRKSVDQIGRFRHIADSWHEISQIALPTTPNDRFSFLVSDGVVVVGVHETVTTPEELFRFVPNDGNIHLLTDLNPQLSHATFAPVRRVEWSTNGGLNITGLLFTPPDYIPGKRYPLVIQTKGDQGWFTCDSGANHDPSFAPQPLAEAGIMYLIRTVAPGFNWQDEIDARPGGYPGEISEAVQEMDIWDSAVRRLNRDGLIDPTKVGIIGFSRTGWEVEFDLFRSATRYAAATAADNVQYSLSEYWLHPQFARSAERMYGGPPYGSTLANWQEYSISFNLDRIHTPLLLEEMGYGSHEDDPKLIPQSLAVRYELSRGLARLGKPVEIYYYPDEVHQPDHPVARLASLERNVDWYRFWLQGYEDRDPCKREQYERWRSLRVLHEQDVARATASVNRQTSPEVKGGLAVSNK